MDTDRRLEETLRELQKPIERMGARHGYDDLYSETCVRVWGRRRAIRDPDRVKNLVWVVAHRILIDARRRVSRALVVNFDASDFLSNCDPTDEGSSGCDPSELVAESEISRRLTIAMRAIPSADQRILAMHYWEYRPINEISRLLGVSRRTVSQRLKRARERLVVAMSRFTSN